MNLPTIAIVGRPNVGKSTLFNAITGKRDALVADVAGLTRDRQYGYAKYQEFNFILIDTGGIGDPESPMDDLIEQQVQLAIEEADLILFVLDARGGLTSADELIAKKLRQVQKPILLVLNKIDGIDATLAVAEFYQLGLKSDPIPVAASHRRGINTLLETVETHCMRLHCMRPQTDEGVLVKQETQNSGIKVAIVGRPNVGKSTLINRLLGEERVIARDEPGTTRDSIFIPFERQNQKYTLIDTAGVRRRGKVKEIIEKFSVIKTLKAIEEAHVVILLIDAHEGLTDQDMRLLGFILESGRALIIAANKWDGLTTDTKERVKSEFDRRLPFLDYVTWHFISALHGTGVGHLYKSIKKAYRSAMAELATPEINRILEGAIASFQPPLVGGKRIKLRYAHSGGQNPPTIVIHGTRTHLLPNSYKRYLEKVFRKAFDLSGTPIKIELRSSTNPYI